MGGRIWFVANGAVTIVESLRGRPYPYGQRNLLFHDEGKGRRFRESSDVAGQAFPAHGRRPWRGGRRYRQRRSRRHPRHDNNGPGSTASQRRAARDSTGSKYDWKASRTNRSGIGARVAVFRDGEEPLWRRVHTDSSYLSASDVRVHFGLGKRPDVQRLMVRWPDGLEESWDNIHADKGVVLRQGSGKAR